jgi:hypothetical protein
VWGAFSFYQLNNGQAMESPLFTDISMPLLSPVHCRPWTIGAANSEPGDRLRTVMKRSTLDLAGSHRKDIARQIPKTRPLHESSQFFSAWPQWPHNQLMGLRHVGSFIKTVKTEPTHARPMNWVCVAMAGWEEEAAETKRSLIPSYKLGHVVRNEQRTALCSGPTYNRN